MYSIHPVLSILIISPVVCYVAYISILRIAFLEFFLVSSLFVYPLVAVFKTEWNSSVVFTSHASLPVLYSILPLIPRDLHGQLEHSCRRPSVSRAGVVADAGVVSESIAQDRLHNVLYPQLSQIGVGLGKILVSEQRESEWDLIPT